MAAGVMAEPYLSSTPGSSEPCSRSNQEQTPVVAVVTAVAEVAGRDPLELPPLRNAINPDALNDLMGAEDNRLTSVSFEYFGYDISVTGDGDVRVASTSGDGF
jgi:hypothetical protein